MKVKGFLYGLIASATFGLIPLFSIPALENGVGLDSLLFYRFSLASVLVAILMWVKKIPFDIQKSEFGIAFILGTLYAITALWLTEAYLYIPSGVATTIHFLYPVVDDPALTTLTNISGDNDPFPLSGGSQPDHVCILQGQADNADTAGNGDGGKRCLYVERRKYAGRFYQYKRINVGIGYSDCLCSLHRRYEPKPDRQARQLESHFLYSAFRSDCLSGKSGDKRRFSRPDAESGHNDRRADGCFPPDVGIRPYTDTGHSLYRFDNDCDLGMHGAAYRRMHGRPFLRRASATDADRRNSSSAISSLHRDIRQLYQEMGAGYPTFIYAPDINDEIFT